MRIEEEIRDDIRILRLSGELDATDIEDVAARLDAAIAARPGDVVLNLEGVRFATVAVLGSVLRAQRRARRRGSNLVISAPSRFVDRLVHVFGLDGRMKVYSGDNDAVRQLRAGGDVAHPHAPCTPNAA